jgi:hypothetical protein
MRIRDRPIAPRSPWQNGCAERLIGSIRRDCLDHVVVFGERHLRHLLKSYQNITTRPARTCHWRRTHRSPAPSRPSVRRWPCPSWADYTTNISEREFPTGTGPGQAKPGEWQVRYLGGVGRPCFVPSGCNFACRLVRRVSGAPPRRSGANRDADPLHYSSSARELDFNGHDIDAGKVRL